MRLAIKMVICGAILGIVAACAAGGCVAQVGFRLGGNNYSGTVKVGKQPAAPPMVLRRGEVK
jgi:high-affinity Fe2+/Pb2+ permease